MTETHDFQEHAKFIVLENQISPSRIHDDRLDWLRNRTVPDCATWLFFNKDFCTWMDVSQNGRVWFWLKGMPGAGKTYLSAAVIDHLRKTDRVLFVFASHANKNPLTALAAIQTFIFQAAEDDKDFQSLLVESNEREIRGSTIYAVAVLKDYLKTAGTTYMIIDGLDEMDDSERRILLQQLDEVAKDCQIRVLICSRAEDDISKALDQKAKTIQVDKENSGSIQKYVNHRSAEWMATCGYDTEAREEVQLALLQISGIADGKSKKAFEIRNPCED